MTFEQKVFAAASLAIETATATYSAKEAYIEHLVPMLFTHLYDKPRIGPITCVPHYTPQDFMAVVPAVRRATSRVFEQPRFNVLAEVLNEYLRRAEPIHPTAAKFITPRSVLEEFNLATLRKQLDIITRTFVSENYLLPSILLLQIRGLIADHYNQECDRRVYNLIDIVTALAREAAAYYIVNGNVFHYLAKPRKMTLDLQYRVHHPTDFAVEWADGTRAAYWMGLRVPNEWYSGEMPTAAEIIGIRNMELRRAGCEKLGWHKIIEELDPVIIDEHPDPQIGTLLEIKLPLVTSSFGFFQNRSDASELLHVKQRLLKVQCGTGRVFALSVPPDVQTALEANAWTYGIDPKNLNPEIRT